MLGGPLQPKGIPFRPKSELRWDLALASEGSGWPERALSRPEVPYAGLGGPFVGLRGLYVSPRGPRASLRGSFVGLRDPL